MARIKVNTYQNSHNADFPCFGIYSNRQIVLFTDYSTGTLVKQGDSTTLQVGTHNDNWSEDWVPYYGTVAITYE